MKNIIVLYHADCFDGFSGAWAAWKKLGNRAEYIPIRHQTPPPRGLVNKTVYMIDIVFPAPTFQELLHRNKRVVVIDHHSTAKEIAETAHETAFDLNHSGAALAWNYFHPQKPLPTLLKVIEENDLWRFKSAYTKPLIAVMEGIRFTFEAWNNVARHLENPKQRKQYIEHGKVILKYKDALVAQITRRAERGTFEGHPVWIVNTPIFESEVGHMLVDQGKGPKIAIIWRQMENIVRVSLRSTPKVNVALLAQKYGGGGHPQAAGFKISAEMKHPWKYLN